MLPRFVAPRARRALARLLRRLRGVERRVVRLEPEGGAPAGRVLLSYVVDPFLVHDPDRVGYAHTQDWECRRMAETWRELGFAVEVIHWTNAAFVPATPPDVLIDPRHNLERLAPHAPEALKLFHAETAHWRTSDDAQRRRLAELEARRGVRLERLRLVGENRGIETADAAVVLGNEWTMATYRPFGKPLFRVPLSNAFTYPSPAGRDFEANRRRFVWFGGPHFVHKGLDVTIEAFAGDPELELAIAAPLDREPDFFAAYEPELTATRNIRPLGWLDVASERLAELARTHVGAVFPSCSEGGGGSAITTMHAGLIPVVTAEASVDVDPTTGVLLADARPETIRAAARTLAARPAAELEALAVAAWERVIRVHTREAFARRYREVGLELLERFRPDLLERARR